MDSVHCGKVPTDKPLLPSDPVNLSFPVLLMVMALAQTKHQLGGFRGIFRDWFPRFPEVLIILLDIAWQIGREAFASFDLRFEILIRVYFRLILSHF